MADPELSPSLIAGQLIDALEEDLPSTGQRRWREEDHVALSSVALLDRSVDSGRIIRGHSVGVTALSGFHSALPFSEIERGLVSDLYDELSYPSGLRDDARNRIPRQRICVEGLERTISGRDLMERWWSWRRGVDEYEGGAGLQVARIAIADFWEGLSSRR